MLLKEFSELISRTTLPVLTWTSVFRMVQGVNTLCRLLLTEGPLSLLILLSSQWYKYLVRKTDDIPHNVYSTIIASVDKKFSLLVWYRRGKSDWSRDILLFCRGFCQQISLEP